jgi:hypothetical protein
MAWAAARTLWFAASLDGVLRHDNLQGFALDAAGGLHVATRLALDGRPLHLPQGYDHIGAVAYAPDGCLYAPVEDAARRAPLLFRFAPGGELARTCRLRHQSHAPWVALHGDSLFSSDFHDVLSVCEYATPSCAPRGCHPLPDTLHGVQGGAFDPGGASDPGGLLYLSATGGPRGPGVYAIDLAAAALAYHIPVCVGPLCLGEIEGLTVNATHLLVSGSYGLWWAALVWKRRA